MPQLPPANVLYSLPDRFTNDATASVVDAYALRSSHQEIAFTVDRSRWGDAEYLDVRCVASIPGYPSLTRERTHRLRLTSDDWLNNDRLVNVKNGAAGE